MIKQYVKQAWQLLRQNKLFGSIYIIGTGLAISLVMVLAIVYYIKIAPIYPEVNRNRTFYMDRLQEKMEDNYSMGAFSYEALKDYFYRLSTPECVSAVYDYTENVLVQLPGKEELVSLFPLYVDVNYWHVFPLRFIYGKPFSQADFDSEICSAVLSVSTARKLFGTEAVVGRYFKVDFKEYRVCGVVEDVSRVTPDTFAEIWMPYTTQIDYEEKVGELGLLGPFKIYILAKSATDFPAVKEEIGIVGKKFSNIKPGVEVSFVGQPIKHYNVCREDSPEERAGTIFRYGIILCMVLLVPAINLTGITSSRMEKRISELGIRRAFGASRREVMYQVLTENFVLTLIGGIVGLLLSYLLVWLGRNWLFEMDGIFYDPLPDGTSVDFSVEMLFNPAIFAIALSVCLIINLLSALLPAWRFSGKNITDSLNYKK